MDQRVAQPSPPLLRDGSERLVAAKTTPGLFRVLGVVPRAGRGLLVEDARPGAAPTALVSERFVRSHFATGPAGVTGRTIRLDGVQTTIIGVVPTAYEVPLGTDLWRPLVVGPDAVGDRAARTLVGVGKLRPGTRGNARVRHRAEAFDENRRDDRRRHDRGHPAVREAAYPADGA